MLNANELKAKDPIEVCYVKITPKRKYIVSDVGIVLEVTNNGFTIVTSKLITKTYNFTDAITVSKLDA